MDARTNRRAGDPLNSQGGSATSAWDFDAANLAALGVFPLDVSNALAVAAPEASAFPLVQQVVFIEGNVPDARQLATGVAPGVLAVVLDPGQDGVAQMAAFLTQHGISNLSAVDIVAHGSDGAVALGSATLDVGTLGQYQTQLAAIGGALAPGGAIQIYGCDVAQDAAGVAFLDQLSAGTGGASVAAASHLVGSAAGGGSWDLNVETGPVSVAAPFTAATEASYQGELATGYIYYALSDGSSTATSAGDAIVRMNTDGTGSTTIASGFTNLIMSMVLDAADNKMFVLDNTGQFQGSATGNTIWSVNLTTGAATKIFTGQTYDNNNGTSVPIGVQFAYDAVNGLIYFMEGTTSTGSRLMSMKTDGSNLTTVTSSAVSSSATGLAIDPTDNLAFVLDSTTADRDIFSVNLTTGATTKIFQNTSGIMGLGVAYNPADGDVYFVQSLNLYKIPANTSSTLSSATLVASNVAGSSVAFFSLDPANGIAYVRGITGGVTQYNQVDLSTGAVTKILAEPSGQFTGDSAVFAPTAQTTFSPSASSPVAGGVGVPESVAIKLGFTGAVYQGTASGSIIVQDLTTNSVVETIAVSSPRITGWGTSTLTIQSSGDLPPDQLAVQWTADAFLDGSLTPLAANASNSAYSFTVIVCFCAGTLIGTPAGEVQVEKLQAGDMVLTAHNGPRKVKWIGTGKVLATRGRRTAATPVIVRKGALADNVPNQDLRVTKAHGLYLDGVLIPVEFLVNHKTILWDDRAQEVEIYHVELDSHDLLLANGAPAESYRD
ncbi:MAG: DUF4347 domain-containing protein, partial [Rhodopila sp.]|nr:DUF4347 domain-containing protein [Rhodopila sp.]